MATHSVTITFTTPTGLTAAEFVRTATDEWGYVASKLENETRLQFFKRMLAKHAITASRGARQREAFELAGQIEDVTSD